MLRNAYLMNGRGRFVAGEDELVLKLRSAIKQAWDYSVLLCFQDKEPTEGIKKESADLFVQGCATGASSVESFLPFPDEREHLQPSNSDFYF
jgi:hypothetical protein